MNKNSLLVENSHNCKR